MDGMEMLEPNLTPLQEAALERIYYFENMLAVHGFRVRMGFEQEFLLTHGEHETPPTNGVLKPTSNETVTGKNNSYWSLVAQLWEEFPNLYEINSESAGAPVEKGWSSLGIYEAKFDTDQIGLSVAPLSVADLATMVWKFRNHGLDTIKEAAKKEGGILQDRQSADDLAISFNPVPFPHHHYYRNQALGMHIGMSVYKDDNNVLMNDEAITSRITNSLLTLQKAITPAFIQTPEALRRISVTSASPKQVSMGRTEFAKADGHSVLLRKERELGSDAQLYTSYSYIEDRLPAANADPFVIAALELGAACYALCTEHEVVAPRNVRLPNNKDWARLRMNPSAESLLGDKLYREIEASYPKALPDPDLSPIR